MKGGGLSMQLPPHTAGGRGRFLLLYLSGYGLRLGFQHHCYFSILKKASFNINELSIRGCKVMHGIDATKMATHELLGHLTFDRIIFNFPFAGFFRNLSRQSQLRRHKRLVSLFLKNAKEMISEEGEIHISHKTNDFHIEWKLEAVAASHRLRLIEAVNFNHLDYPGYNTKCGFGGDNNFNCNPSKTYKFGLKYY
ncbi:Heavy metal-associated isoprenylated plant protein 41 [Sesamum angolense]|uniref:Heavy metal-associated isoprenylated plant protein 41 n=1 Tax=Sesamum angolense TaxID=2727404 RepID=A0AAE1T415_9LAMI|nr:Heavy metal-associated isoprenylated plant protein 41 [Sesamum angolense]